MILNDPLTVKEPKERVASQACLSISQLLVFNSVATDHTSSVTQHSREKECPLPIFVALKIRGTTRSKTLVESIYNIGLSISYDRLLCLSTEVVNSVCAHFQSEGVMCPPKLRTGLFTMAAVNNFDHNPSLTS